ncbi:MAG: Uma2 family endonuclease [Jatrophihabitantaceae bacterium]
MDGGTVQQLADLPQTWTFEQLQLLLPQDADWRRYEIVDGALVVSPSASFDHEVVSALLRAQLQGQVPAGHLVLGPMTVQVGLSYRIPDLLVVPTELFGQGRSLVAPSEVLLAVEIVSPSSRTTDRITKPAQYAAAGIPAYWRVETEPDVTITAYVLQPGAGVYTEVGEWVPGQSLTLAEPFPITFAIDALVPPT